MFVNTEAVPNAEKARALHQNARAQIDAIRLDQNLSHVGRRQQIETVYNDVTSKLDALRGAHKSAQTKRKTDLETSLFGRLTALTGAEAISFRDADDRAARVADEAEAIDLIERATQLQDRVLRNAVARRAITERWIAPLETWAGGSQRVEDQLSELLKITADLGEIKHGSALIAADLALEMLFRFPKPSELEEAETWTRLRDQAEGRA